MRVVLIVITATTLAGCATNEPSITGSVAATPTEVEPTAVAPSQAAVASTQAAVAPRPAAATPRLPRPAAAAAAPASSSLKAHNPVKLTDADITAIKDGVRKSLKDPESASFGAMKAGSGDGTTAAVTVCGYVNAKSSFGGYIGEQLFVGVITRSGPKKGFHVIGMGGTETSSLTAKAVCGAVGLVPS
jgi:hypothetical protein